MVLSKKKIVKSLVIQWHYLIFFVRKSHLWSNKRSRVLSIFAYIKNQLVSSFDNKEQSSRADIISWNFLSQKKKKRKRKDPIVFIESRVWKWYAFLY